MLGIAFGFEEESAMDRFNNRALARFIWPTDEGARWIEVHRQFAMQPTIPERDRNDSHGVFV